MLSGYAIAAPLLKDKWTLLTGAECREWTHGIRALWRKAGEIFYGEEVDTGGLEMDSEVFKSRKVFGFDTRRVVKARQRRSTISDLFGNEEYTEAVLEFLEETIVGFVNQGVLNRS